VEWVNLRVTGIGPKRAEIIVPGVAVLMCVLEMFHLPSMYHSAAGVRDGIIADLAARGVGRELAHLSRDQRREVEQMARRFGVSLEHGRAVAGRCLDLQRYPAAAPVAPAPWAPAGSGRVPA
jgi:exopolyphosphatase/guanosine-5'-triphosphate,3'-diphosphate pyrophosphatase